MFFLMFSQVSELVHEHDCRLVYLRNVVDSTTQSYQDSLLEKIEDMERGLGKQLSRQIDDLNLLRKKWQPLFAEENLLLGT